MFDASKNDDGSWEFDDMKRSPNYTSGKKKKRYDKCTTVFFGGVGAAAYLKELRGDDKQSLFFGVGKHSRLLDEKYMEKLYKRISKKPHAHYSDMK